MTATEKLLNVLPKKYHDRVDMLDYIGEEDCKYQLWLKDGWVFDDNSHVISANTISEAKKEVMSGTYPEDEIVSFNG